MRPWSEPSRGSGRARPTLRKLDGTKALLAAIERALAAGRGPQVLQVKDLTLNLAARRAWRGDEEIPLTRLEFDLLAYLVRNSGRAVSYDELLTGVWGYGPADGDPAQVRVALSRLRRKLKEEPGRRIIVTMRGVGCRIDRE